MEKWVMVTGSNRGIGDAVLEKFAENGYDIIAHARTGSEEFEARLVSLEKKYQVKIVPVYFDVRDIDGMKASMQMLSKEKYQIEILINNAGVMHSGLFMMTDMETIREIYEVNLFSVMELTQLVLRMMVRKKRGSIVNVSSITGMDLSMGQSAYGVSKAAVAAFTRTLAQEVGNYGIRVNAVAPGIVDTRMAKEESAAAQVSRLEAQKGAFKRCARPSEVADVIYYLASEAASFVNGQILRVDGGNYLI